ncbi:hypothetical protein AAXB25_15025 [Paenibacillus lautus]|uniref:hypothetical protein n=1 Tax=Paenibacillus lautus TaxID=1401 RepID=UPI003D2BCA07
MRFTEGQKVVPIRKSVGKPLESSIVWKEAKASKQPFLFVSYYDHDLDRYVCSNIIEIKDGDFFTEYDLVPYEEYEPTPKLVSELGPVSYKKIVVDALKKLS